MINQAMKFLRGAWPISQVQKSNVGADASMKKSKNTINKAPNRIFIEVCFTKLSAIAAVQKISTAQLMPIRSGTPSILLPKFESALE